MATTKKRTPSGGRKTSVRKAAVRKVTVKRATAAPRAKPKRLEKIADVDSLKVEPADKDATKRVNKIKTEVEKRKPSVRTRGPSGVSRTAVDRLDDPSPASGVVLIERVLDSIERELVAIDKVTGDGHINAKQRTESERRARTLASLAKTLGEVTRLRGLHDKNLHDKKAKSADDAAVPRDLDEFRRELARRLDGLAAGDQDLRAEGDVRDGDAMAGSAVADLCPSASETA